MDLLQKSMELIGLYDRYQELLTDKQRDYFEQYYHQDFSISEISENEGVSRNAVHDLIKRTVQKLYDYETHLHLYEQGQKRDKLIETMKRQTTDNTLLELLEELSKVE